MPSLPEAGLAGFPRAARPALAGDAADWQASALAFPADLAARAFLPAWGIALVLHVALLAAVLFAPSPAPPPEEPLVRMVFVAPPPPPPAPLGVPNATGHVAAIVEPEVRPQPVRPQPKPQVKPRRERLARPERVAKPKPKPEPKPEAPPAVADVAPGVQAGAVGGEPAGVVGGVSGGVAGGVVGGGGTGPMPAGQVAHPPVLVRRVEPVYPQVARRQQLEGLVVLEAILDRDGRVEPNVKVLRSVPLLDREALAAVRKWRFRPARNAKGDAVRVILEVPIRFVLR